MMKRCVPILIVAAALTARLHGQFDPEEWPETADPDALVHFVSTDQTFLPLGDGWTESLQILSGGDQITQDHWKGPTPGAMRTSRYRT